MRIRNLIHNSQYTHLPIPSDVRRSKRPPTTSCCNACVTPSMPRSRQSCRRPRRRRQEILEARDHRNS